MTRLRALAAAALLLLAAAVSACGSNHQSDNAVRLDYAYYNPLSLVVRDQHLLEHRGLTVTWVYSAGSNKANAGLRADAIDIGSTAGSAALLARANATPIKTVYIFSQPEWTSLLVPKGSPITSLDQLRGKRIAATKGTDPYFFLLQSLATVGLTGRDVQVVNLQHQDGKTALERGQVDAWSGLEPYISQTLQSGASQFLYRNPSFSTYGVLNAREDVIRNHPDLVRDVIDAYQQARTWAVAHPTELAALLAADAQITVPVAAAELARTDLTVDPTPGPAERAVLDRIAPILVADNDARSAQDVTNALATLFDTDFTHAGTPS